MRGAQDCHAVGHNHQINFSAKFAVCGVQCYEHAFPSCAALSHKKVSFGEKKCEIFDGYIRKIEM